MIIIQDSREQNPLRFSGLVPVEIGTLETGDYAIKGLEHQVCIERKSLSDLLGSITADRERFIRELKRMRQFRFAAIVVETDWPTILMKAYPQNVNPSSVVGSLMAFAIKYGVVPILAGDHQTAADLVERMLLTYAGMIDRDFRAMTNGEGLEVRTAPKRAQKAAKEEQQLSA